MVQQIRQPHPCMKVDNIKQKNLNLAVGKHLYVCVIMQARIRMLECPCREENSSVREIRGRGYFLNLNRLCFDKMSEYTVK